MELLTIAALLGSGILLNKKKINENKNNNETLNIYNSNQFKLNNEYEFNLVSKHNKLSHDYTNTNIIPRYINSLYSNENMIENPDYNKELIYSIIDTFDNETKQEIKQSSQQGGTILPNRGHEPKEGHNNMVPFFGGRMKQNMSQDNILSDNKLDLFTGQMKLNKPKEEVEPFFQPVKDLTYITGSVEQRDLSRYNPSNLGKANNELPFEQIQVGRGLNDGYTDKPSGGFHQTLRILPTRPEDYRIDPVFEQEGRIIKGKLIDKRPLQKQVHKNKQSLLVENKNGERNFTTVGVIKGRKMRPTINLKTTGRAQSGQIIGAGYNKNTGAKIRAKVKLTNRQKLKAEPFRNLVKIGELVDDYGKEGYHETKPTQRSLRSDQLKGNAHTSIQLKSKLHNINDPKKTRKQTTIDNVHKTMNTRPEHTKHITYDPNDVAKTTVKETTLIENYKNNINMPNKKHITSDPTDITRTTVKETTLAENYIGGMSKENKKHITYDPNDVAKTTVKETTLAENYIGGMSKENKKHIAYDPQDIAKPTNKHELSNNEYMGGANSKSKKMKTYDAVYNADLNINKEQIAKGRKPTKSCVKLFNSTQNIQVNKLEEDRVNQRAQSKSSNFGDLFNNTFNITSVKNELPLNDKRLDSKTLDGLKQNPLALRKPIFA